jgi:hypothetical protein
MVALLREIHREQPEVAVVLMMADSWTSWSCDRTPPASRGGSYGSFSPHPRGALLGRSAGWQPPATQVRDGAGAAVRRQCIGSLEGSGGWGQSAQVYVWAGAECIGNRRTTPCTATKSALQLLNRLAALPDQ